MIVELSPFVWLMMLPPLAYMEYMKIKHEIPGDDLAGVGAGIYAESPVLLSFTILVEVALPPACRPPAARRPPACRPPPARLRPACRPPAARRPPDFPHLPSAPPRLPR